MPARVVSARRIRELCGLGVISRAREYVPRGNACVQGNAVLCRVCRMQGRVTRVGLSSRLAGLKGFPASGF